MLSNDSVVIIFRVKVSLWEIQGVILKESPEKSVQINNVQWNFLVHLYLIRAKVNSMFFQRIE